jgi:hypothetical protein
LQLLYVTYNKFACQKPQPGHYSYSGMHDTGELPPLREGGHMADMISYVLAAKSYNDEYLTALMNEEPLQETNSPMTNALNDTKTIDCVQPHVKKPRMEE